MRDMSNGWDYHNEYIRRNPEERCGQASRKLAFPVDPELFQPHDVENNRSGPATLLTGMPGAGFQSPGEARNISIHHFCGLFLVLFTALFFPHNSGISIHRLQVRVICIILRPIPSHMSLSFSHVRKPPLTWGSCRRNGINNRMNGFDVLHHPTPSRFRPDNFHRAIAFTEGPTALCTDSSCRFPPLFSFLIPDSCTFSSRRQSP
jgi:hypothetical protein